MDSIQPPISVNDAAADAECAMCSQIVEFLTGSFSRDHTIELGIVGDLLAQNCPHSEWLRDLKYNYGTVPYYETRDLELDKSENRRSASLTVCYLTKSSQCSSSSQDFELVFRPEVPHHPGTARVLDSNWVDLSLIKDWPALCMKAHSAKCDETLGSLAPFRPQYLIDVTRYCIVLSTEVFPRFVALSYTWGQTKSFRTTMSTKEQLEQPGSLKLPHIASQVPNTIRDTIELTRLLGENWLWVDSLCVVQDDPVALGHELKQMHRIYASSFLTIIAKDGHNADYGLRGLYGISSARCTQQSIVPLARGERLSFMETDWSRSSSTIFDYTRRMWTFQEQVFSKRCLTFGSGYVTWQCNCANWTEHQIYHPEADGALGGDLHEFKHLMVPHVPSLNNLATLVESFNRRSLNFEEDVFDAFSGFHTHLNGLYPSGLVFGHPELYFDISLCWHTVLRYSCHRRKPARYCSSGLFRHRLPSWSWMGWYGYTVFPADSEHQFRTYSYTGFTESVTEFYIIESPRASMKKRVDCNWSQFRNANTDHMPSGWKRTKYEPPIERSRNMHTEPQYGTDFTPVSTSKEQPSYLYSHATDGDDPDLYWYPVPVADSSSEEGTEHQAYREYQYLWFQTTKACLLMSVESISTGSSKFNLIKDTNGNTVGELQISCNKESEVLHEGITVELIAIVKGWTPIFKESESGFLDRLQVQVRLLYERPELLTKEEEEKEWHDITNRSPVKDEVTEKDTSGSDKERRQDCYHVLWIEREDQVSYRKGVGFVLVDDWERLAESTKIEVVLG